MRKLNSLMVAGALTMSLFGCKQQKDTHDADVQAIKDTEVQWVKDYASKDVDKIGSHYTDDATMMMSDSPSITGKEGIVAALKKMTADPLFSVTFHSTDVDVAQSGEIGYSQGKFATTSTDPITKTMSQTHGDYLTVYRKQPDGSWKAVDDWASSEVPPLVSTAGTATKPVKAFHPKPFD